MQRAVERAEEGRQKADAIMCNTIEIQLLIAPDYYSTGDGQNRSAQNEQTQKGKTQFVSTDNKVDAPLKYRRD